MSLELCIPFSKYFVLEQLDGWVEYSNHDLNDCSLQWCSCYFWPEADFCKSGLKAQHCTCSHFEGFFAFFIFFLYHLLSCKTKCFCPFPEYVQKLFLKVLFHLLVSLINREERQWRRWKEIQQCKLVFNSAQQTSTFLIIFMYLFHSKFS